MPTSIPFHINNPSGDRIQGDLHLPASLIGGPFPVILLLHGFKSFKDWGFHPYVANYLADHQMAVVRFNFSHNGVGEDFESFTCLDQFARNTYSKELEDTYAILDSLLSGSLPGADHLDLKRIGILAHSRGAAAALMLSIKSDWIRTLVTWAGISRLDRWSSAIKEIWRREGILEVPNLRTGQIMPIRLSLLEDAERIATEHDLTDCVARLSIPYMVVHGDDDETVPLEEAMRLHEHTPRGLRRLQIIPGAGHTFGAQHPFKESTPQLEEALRVTLEWFGNRL